VYRGSLAPFTSAGATALRAAVLRHRCGREGRFSRVVHAAYWRALQVWRIDRPVAVIRGPPLAHDSCSWRLEGRRDLRALWSRSQVSTVRALLPPYRGAAGADGIIAICCSRHLVMLGPSGHGSASQEVRS
jgi:hypothetical protein